MRRRQLLPLAVLALLAGCDARSGAGLHQDAYVAGGYGSPFYAEVPYAAEEGGRTRVYLLGTIAAFDSFVATKKVDELRHKKLITGGTTLIVETQGGLAAKEDPRFADRLIASYKARHPAPAAVAE